MNSLGIQAEVIYLNGAQEIAPILGLSDAIIDLVDTGKTLKENGLEELKVIANISTRLIANKASIKTRSKLINEISEALKPWLTLGNLIQKIQNSPRVLLLSWLKER